MTSERLVMSREWLAAVLDVVATARARRVNHLPLYARELIPAYIPTTAEMPRCPYPSCNCYHTDEIRVEHPHQSVPLDTGPFAVATAHLTLTWRPCGHVFRVPVETAKLDS